jgi:delta1-piperideine-2-carboxylate reductase
MPAPDHDPVLISASDAMALMTDVATRLGFSPADAAAVARHLVDDQLRGVVGMSRIFIVADEVERDGPEVCEAISVQRESEIFATVDGGRHHGMVVAEYATELAIAKAHQGGVSVVCANNHRYSGTLAYYVEMAARAGLIGMAIASGSFSSVAPYGGREGRVDTNPIALGFPTTTEPIVWDIATSALSGSEVHRRLISGEQLPAGMAIDAAGAETVDPATALAGAILTWGGHRGSGLAQSIRLLALLCGVAPFPQRGDEFGFLIIVIDPARFLPPGQFEAQASEFAAGIRATPTAAGFSAVRVPFDRSISERERSRQDGVELPRAVYDRLTTIAARP